MSVNAMIGTTMLLYGVINPIGVVPIYLSLVRRIPAERALGTRVRARPVADKCPMNREIRKARHQLVHEAFEVRRQMLNDDERRPRAGR